MSSEGLISIWNRTKEVLLSWGEPIATPLIIAIFLIVIVWGTKLISKVYSLEVKLNKERKERKALEKVVRTFREEDQPSKYYS